MPPIPIYSHSPINAAKAGGVTPQTAEKAAQEPTNNHPPPPTTTQNTPPYPAAQPGAVPALPVPTGSLQQQQQQHEAPLQPTPTQHLTAHQGPPLPQPNAFPVPPNGASARQPPQATQTQPPPPPPPLPQMSIPPPPAATTQGAQRGTTIAFPAAPPSASLAHPPGYVQNPHASEMSRYQRAAQEALDRQEDEEQRRGSDGSSGGMWGSVRGAVAAAGGKIAAAEEQVWKKINNKDV